MERNRRRVVENQGEIPSTFDWRFEPRDNETEVIPSVEYELPVLLLLRAAGGLYLTYSAGQWPPPARGMEFKMLYYGFLDRASFGRNEGDQPMMWVRRHDEYDSS